MLEFASTGFVGVRLRNGNKVCFFYCSTGWDVVQLNCPIRFCDTVVAVADVSLGEVAG